MFFLVEHEDLLVSARLTGNIRVTTQIWQILLPAVCKHSNSGTYSRRIRTVGSSFLACDISFAFAHQD